MEVHLLIDGRQRLAVATPGGIELNEDILAAEYHLLEGVGSHHLDRAVIVLRGLLALDELGHLASLGARRAWCQGRQVDRGCLITCLALQP